MKSIKLALYGLSLLLGIVSSTFILFFVIPTNPARVMLGANASEESVNLLSKELGTDRPIFEQYFFNLYKLLKFDFGHSIIDKRSVSIEIKNKFITTLKLGFYGLLLTLFISYFLNLIVFYAPKFNFIIKLSKLGVSTPPFFSGILVALIAGVFFPIIPLSGFDPFSSSMFKLIVPIFLVGLYPIAIMTEIMYEKIHQVSTQNFVISAFALGFSRFYVFHFAILRSIAVTLMAVWINLLSVLFIGSMIIEVIYTIPGVGPLIIKSVQQRDYPMLQGIVITNACFFIICSWLSEMIYHNIDPRIQQNVS